jgi:hypothetical protein
MKRDKKRDDAWATSFSAEKIQADFNDAQERFAQLGRVIGNRADLAVNFDWRCYFCTTAVQVAISASVGAAFGALVAGGEVAAATASALAALIAPVIGMGVEALADFIIECMKDCDSPGALVQMLANKACKC